MNRLHSLLIVSGLLLAINCTAALADEIDLQLTLPNRIYAAEGQEVSIYFDNIVLTEQIESYDFQVACPVGALTQKRWWVKPTHEDVGVSTLKVTVSSKLGETLAEASTVLEILPADAGAKIEEKIQLLIIGDSLTHASAYSNRFAELLSMPGNPEFKMLGTHHPASATEAVFHEGYSGWTWQRFAEHYEPNPDGTHRKRSSPFVFLDKSKQPQLDFDQYFDEHCGGNRPDYIIILLGINDCFSAPSEDVAGIDSRIDSMFKHSRELLAKLQASAPDAQIGLCATTPPNARQAAFKANYQDRYTRWGWKRIQHRLVQRQIEFVNEMHDSRISLIPTQLNLDPVDGYPEKNGVHPNKVGYHQIATSLYAWLKDQLSDSNLK